MALQLRVMNNGRIVVCPARNGMGLFAVNAFRPNDQIMRVAGTIVAADTVWDRGGRFADNCFRFGPETYLDPGAEPGRYLNHSCEPNAGLSKVSNRLFLFAITRIRAKDEIAIDYSTTLGDDDIWTMRCRCGSDACRKRIGNFGSLPSRLQDHYVRIGAVPKYILATLQTSVFLLAASAFRL